MKIEGLPKLNSMSPLNSETAVCHDQNTRFHLFCNPKVEMGSFKTLSLTGCFKDNIKNIWCRQIPPNFFNKLQELRIYHMHGIKSLLSCPIARNLVSLRFLYIEDCKVMVEVIKSDAVEAVDHMPLLFPTLKVLSIMKLLELRSFWPVNHPLELPLLEYVDIQQCPVMKTFTSGSLKTPKIRMIDINNHQINDQKDLNRVTHQYCMTSDFGQNSSTKSINECLREIGNCIPIQCVWSFLEPHFNYWWCFDSNIQEFRDGIRDLDRQTYDVQQRIEAARFHAETLRPGVQEWLEADTEEHAKVRRILAADSPNKWNLISRYSMGKSAKEAAEKIAKHRNDGNFISISDPAPPACMASTSQRQTMDFESRKQIEEEIMKSLKNSSISTIAICGMGGVGKTTMAERIGRRVMDENLLDEEVVTVVVGQQVDMIKIQEEIAECLELKLDEKHMSTRAAKLRARLMDIKRKLIIFDDVWESLRFEDLGIPVESNFERCKVLLTSRSRDTCKRIENKKVLELKILEEEEAWILFKEKAGNSIEASDLLPVAKDVAARCKGLPIALVNLGWTLKDKMNIYNSKDLLSQLRKSKPTDLLERLRQIYETLKLSYDYLDDDRQQYLFLLCCLFPEDYDIPIEQLSWYSVGLQLFHDITNIEEARNLTHKLVKKLKSGFLLIDGKNKLHVKMHDVVRDVAIYIGSIEKEGFLKSLSSIKNSSDVNCNWMSMDISNERMEVPVVSRFPKLRLLMLQNSKSSSNELSDISFEGMKELNVLSFESASIRSLPPTLGSLENLQTLSLFDCEVENISVIGKLTSLKILSCYGCANINELPAEIGRLKALRLLVLSGCKRLQKIPFGVISNLVLLEELKIRRSFSEWETGGERRNASLTELGYLRNLSCLEIEIDDCTLSAQEIRLSQKLVKYYIRIGSNDYHFEDGDYEKVMNLKLPGAVGNWIQLLARNAESLSLKGDGSENFYLAENENLKNLNFNECSTVKKLGEARRSLLQLEVLEIRSCEAMEEVFWNGDNTYDCIEFPKLKELTLDDLPNLIAFYQGIENIIIKFPSLTTVCIDKLPKLNSLFPLNSETLDDHNTSSIHFVCNPKDVLFGNLKSIYISQCNKLRYLFSVSAARTCLLQLEVLSVSFCDAMEQVFWNEGTEDNTDCCIEFPKLKEMTLLKLPNLTAFCQGLENNVINFPNLTEMDIGGLPSLKYGVFPLSSEIPCNLKSIKIEDFSNLKHLFSGSVARTILLQLEVLEIQFCESMEEVFWNADNTYDCIEFSKLKKLTLVDLPNLTAFCQGIENIIIKFPNLTEMKIEALPKLNSLSHLNSETVVLHDQNTCFHLFCNPKVEIGPLHSLTLSSLGDNIRNIWCCQIPNNFFNNLERLEISYMNGIRSLMSTSIAKNLVSLKYLIISYCEEMVEVIEIDDDDKQIVDINCLFSNLRQLNMWSLHKLRRFWQWNHAMELPLLEQVRISNCPVIETFTLGFINTPNMKEILVNSKKIDTTKIDDQNDLNDVIRHIWTESRIKDEFEDYKYYALGIEEEKEAKRTRMMMRQRFSMKLW